MYVNQCVSCGVEFQTLFEDANLYCTPQCEDKHSLFETDILEHTQMSEVGGNQY